MNEKIVRRAIILILAASGLFVLITAEIEKNYGQVSIGRHRAGGSETYTLEENKNEFEETLLKKRIIGFALLGLGAATVFVWKGETNHQN